MLRTYAPSQFKGKNLRLNYRCVIFGVYADKHALKVLLSIGNDGVVVSAKFLLL